MYKAPKYYDSKQEVKASSCMYSLNSFYDASTNSQKNMEGDGALDSLTERQDTIIKRLADLEAQVKRLRNKCQTPATQGSSGVADAAQPAEELGDVLRDMVVHADPNQPPLSVLVLHELLSKQYKVLPTCYVHSSAKHVSDNFRQVLPTDGTLSNRSDFQLALTLIWKDESCGCSLMISPSSQTAIQGEASVARYLGRLLRPAYDGPGADVVRATQVDDLLDQAAPLARGNNKERAGVLRNLNGKLGRQQWLVGDDLSLADIVLWSVIQRTKQTESAPANVKKWLDTCSSHAAFQSALRFVACLA